MICGIFNAATGNPKPSHMGGGTGRPAWGSEHCAALPFPRDQIAAGAKTRWEKGQMSVGLGQRGARPGRRHLCPAILYGASPKVTQHHTHGLGQCHGQGEGREHGEVGEGAGLRDNCINTFIAVTASGCLPLLGTGRNGRVGPRRSFLAAHNTRETPFLKVSATSVFCPTSGVFN